ncbi:hypothetical protein spyM18_1319 [Streptococcus pyogenes MGAS8232]|nr:hypothetical protein spyM18_1319 [Streptococcus pyogenes MGAS8232]
MTVNTLFSISRKTTDMLSQVVKSSATSSSITRVPEVKLFGIAQTGILRIAIEEVVLGAH